MRMKPLLVFLIRISLHFIDLWTSISRSTPHTFLEITLKSFYLDMHDFVQLTGIFGPYTVQSRRLLIFWEHLGDNGFE